MNASGIYGIQNKITFQWYIGQSRRISSRFRCHKRKLISSTHHNSHLQSAFSKYGGDAFLFIVLETSDGDLDQLERYWIAALHSNHPSFGYNKESGGSSNKVQSCETKRLISMALTGRSFSDSHKKNISQSKTHPPPETRQRISEARKSSQACRDHTLSLSEKHKGQPLSVATKQRISESLKKLPERSASWRQSLSKSLLGKKKSVDHCAQISKAMKGRVISEEWRKRISSSGKGRKVSLATRIRQSAALKGRVFTEEWKRKIAATRRRNAELRKSGRNRRLNEPQEMPDLPPS